MTILRRLFKCLCVCVYIEKGSWSPKTDKIAPPNHKVVITKRTKNEHYKKSSDSFKPEWLKQWTISKGWSHDRTHMLSLGQEGNSSGNLVAKEEQLPEIEIISNSSIDNASDLLSIIDNIENASTSGEMRNNEIKETTVCNKTIEEEFDKIEIDTTTNTTDVYSEVNVNYRKHFPVVSKSFVLDESPKTKSSNYSSFKKYFKPKEKEIKYSKIVFPNRQNLFHTSKENLIKTPVTKYKTFDDLTTIECEYEDISKMAKRRSLQSNFTRSIQQDTIYECSEDSFSLYTNPIYESHPEFENDGVQIIEGKDEIDFFNKTSSCEYQKCLNKDLNTNKFSSRNEFIRGNHLKSIKSKFSSEKYIIRHIRIRIMLTLRLKKFQKLYRKRLSNTKHFYSKKDKKKRKVKDCDMSEDVIRSEILKVHDEQRRIGNGKTSLKIQNLR